MTRHSGVTATSCTLKGACSTVAISAAEPVPPRHLYPALLTKVDSPRSMFLETDLATKLSAVSHREHPDSQAIPDRSPSRTRWTPCPLAGHWPLVTCLAWPFATSFPVVGLPACQPCSAVSPLPSLLSLHFVDCHPLRNNQLY